MNLPTAITTTTPPQAPPAITDLRDPRLRITFADVAMKIASDGPMYAVILLVGVLAIRGTTTALESIVGAAIALLARSHPPPGVDKFGRNLAGAAIAICLLGALHVASSTTAAPRPRVDLVANVEPKKGWLVP